MPKNKQLIFFIALVSLLFPVVVFASYPMIHYPYVPAAERVKANGEYSIYVMKNGDWREAGKLSFDQFYREREIDLSSYLTGDQDVRVKLVEKGGEAAHIDSVFLGGKPPVEVKDVADGLKKLSKSDFDVLDAFGKSIEILFNKDAKAKTLKLTARVEGINRGLPFQFPISNLYRKVDRSAHFYTYKLGAAKGAIDLDGRLDKGGERVSPFFREYSLAGTGHPSGFTYGWVWNDTENLYVYIDFTPDDTMDGNKDYTKVYVNMPDGVKEFKVSEAEKKWGAPGFTYTDKVAYQHKVYEFKIPLREIMGEQNDGRDKVLLAFSAYGTAGHCCFPDGACSTDYPALCEINGGVFVNGAPFNCDPPNPCPQPEQVPTMTQWGLISFAVLAGLIAVYRSRRQAKK
jgi:hypothetical protein